MYSLKKMTQKISKTYTLSFPKAAHLLEAQDQGVVHKKYVSIYVTKCRDMCVHSIKVRMRGHTLQFLYRVHGKWLFREKLSNPI